MSVTRYDFTIMPSGSIRYVRRLGCSGLRSAGGGLRPVGPPALPVAAGEKREREAVLLGERLVLLGRIERGAQDLCARLFELWGSVTEPLAFRPSTRGEGLGEPPEHDPTAPQILQGDGVPVLVRKGERWALRSLSEHRPLRRTSRSEV